MRIPPHRADAGLAFAARPGADGSAQLPHTLAVQRARKIIGCCAVAVDSQHSGLRRPRYKEARLHASSRADHRGKLRRVAVNRRIGSLAVKGAEVLQDAPQLGGTLRDEARTKIGRALAFQVAQQFVQHGQLFGKQGQIAAETLCAAKGVRIGHIDSQKGNLPCAEILRQRHKTR